MLAIAGDQLENETSSAPAVSLSVLTGPSHAPTDLAREWPHHSVPNSYINGIEKSIM